LDDASIRTLVVDDSALMRAMISRILRRDPGIEVVGVARNGVEAIERALELAPDVVTLDIQMPEMDGLTALKELIRRRLGRVVMLSAQDDTETVYNALASGAIDFVSKPSGNISVDIEALAEILSEKVRIAAGADQTKADASVEAIRKSPAREEPELIAEMAAQHLERIIAIGASTGGPPAIESILSQLPPNLSAAILIVQHLPTGFSEGFCKRLSRAAPIPVKEAKSGQILRPGQILVAPAGAHLEIVHRPETGLTVRLMPSAPVHGVRPSVDVTFKSLARAVGDRGIGVVLTGMGVDGAEGLQEIRQAGGRTIVQDEATAVVFGMPGAAIRAGAAERVVPLSGIGKEILKGWYPGVRR
jgi:two-component system, chemotaxis family, protein-glutamate methylesterase/glutaminase